jgi:ubiquinone/menaquinone biosynthesis C-methylase UbiE
MPRSPRTDHVAKVTESDAAENAVVAKRFDRDYWDGERRFGFGGYRYDGRWRPVAERIAAHYGLKAGERVLDVGCGKGFLLYELTQVVPGLIVTGIDISAYAIANAKPEVKDRLTQGNCNRLPFADASFDLVYAINVLHNLYVFDVIAALKELQRVGRGRRFICEESYRSEHEKTRILYWALTCECFHTPDEWRWLYAQAGYDGDTDFIFFE